MKTKIIDENVMSYFYEKDGWLYWNQDIGKKIKKDSLAGYFHKASGYYEVKINGKNYQMHRILYQFYHNVILKETDVIDHIDRNKQNNSKENLRLDPNKQNSMNRKVSKNNKSTGLKNIYKKTNKAGNVYYWIKISKYKKVVFSKWCSYRSLNG